MLNAIDEGIMNDDIKSTRLCSMWRRRPLVVCNEFRKEIKVISFQLASALSAREMEVDIRGFELKKLETKEKEFI